MMDAGDLGYPFSWAFQAQAKMILSLPDKGKPPEGSEPSG
jgi:hypothetical protein